MRLSIFRAGRAAERRAARYLSRRGFVILASNIQRGGGEIDILATELGVLVVVEVRQRAAGNLAADLSIDRDKERRLAECLRVFLREKEASGLLPVRFDTVLVDGKGHCSHQRGTLNRE